MVTKASKLLSVGDVAERFGVSKQQVVRAIRAGALPAEKLGWFWTIRERDLPEKWGK